MSILTIILSPVFSDFILNFWHSDDYKILIFRYLNRLYLMHRPWKILSVMCPSWCFHLICWHYRVVFPLIQINCQTYSGMVKWCWNSWSTSVDGSDIKHCILNIKLNLVCLKCRYKYSSYKMCIGAKLSYKLKTQMIVLLCSSYSPSESCLSLACSLWQLINLYSLRKFCNIQIYFHCIIIIVTIRK